MSQGFATNDVFRIEELLRLILAFVPGPLLWRLRGVGRQWRDAVAYIYERREVPLDLIISNNRYSYVLRFERQNDQRLMSMARDCEWIASLSIQIPSDVDVRCSSVCSAFNRIADRLNEGDPLSFIDDEGYYEHKREEACFRSVLVALRSALRQLLREALMASEEADLNWHVGNALKEYWHSEKALCGAGEQPSEASTTAAKVLQTLVDEGSYRDLAVVTECYLARGDAHQAKEIAWKVKHLLPPELKLSAVLWQLLYEPLDQGSKLYKLLANAYRQWRAAFMKGLRLRGLRPPFPNDASAFLGGFAGPGYWDT